MMWQAAALISTAILLSTAAFATPISPAGAKTHVGETVTVEGRIAEIHFDRRSGTTFIDFGGRYPSNAFTGVIFDESRSAFPGVTSLAGRMVDVSGSIELYRGKPEMILKLPSQMRIVD